MKKTLIKKSPIISLKVIYLICTVFILTVLSCSKNEDGIIKESISEANLVTSQGIENAPNQSGIFVFRYSLEGILAYTLVDPKTQLVLTTNYPDRLPTYCGGDVPTDIIDVQEIITGDNEFHHTVFAEGEVGVKVFQGPFVWDNNLAEFCEFIANAPLLAEGTAHILYHDNDIYGAYSPNHTNIFGFSVQGQVTTPEGELKQLSGRSIFLWPNDVENVNSILDVLINVTVQLN